MNVFETFAANASSERLQETWARVLAGQIRRPQSFSIRTLRAISEIDQRTATIFETAAAFVVSGEWLPSLKPELISFEDLVLLQNAGLLTGVGGLFNKTFSMVPNVGMPLGKFALIIIRSESEELSLSSFLLTEVGKELLKLVNRSNPLGVARVLAERLPKTPNMNAIVFGPAFIEADAESASKADNSIVVEKLNFPLIIGRLL